MEKTNTPDLAMLTHPDVIIDDEGTVDERGVRSHDTHASWQVLRTFAVAHGKLAFAHIVTEALNGGELASEMIYEYHACVGDLRFSTISVERAELNFSEMERIVAWHARVNGGAVPRSFTP